MTHESIRPSESQEANREYNRDETDYDVIRSIEQEEMLQNPENVGFNLTMDQLINPRRLGEIAVAQKLIEEVGEEAAFSQLSEKYERPASEIQSVFESTINEEMSKLDNFKDYLNRLPDGVSFRVHPFAPFSPFSLENFRHSGEDGDYLYCDPIAIEQMKLVYEKVNSGEEPGDLSIVMNPYTNERGGNIPDTPEEIQAYSDMCLKFLEQMGLDADAGGICLELGNETNVDHSTLGSNGEPMFKTVDFADHADPIKYAHMYSQVAATIKAKYPNVKVAIAGTAMFDEKFLESVIKEVNNPDLIDKISFHPYRETVDEGAPTYENGRCVDSPLSYEQQLKRMEELAEMAGATYDVGEASFSHAHGESVDMAELHRNSAEAKARCIKTYIWPETQILEYENPNR